MRLKAWIERHPLLATLTSFAVLTIPQWVASVWALFSSEPLIPWLVKHDIPHLGFSAWWITIPTGLFMFAVVIWLNRRKVNQHSGPNQPTSHAAHDVDLNALIPVMEPRLSISCGPNHEGCTVTAIWSVNGQRLPVKFLRVAVGTNSSSPIKNATGFLQRVERSGQKNGATTMLN
jgi:hypothetical protein